MSPTTPAHITRLLRHVTLLLLPLRLSLISFKDFQLSLSFLLLSNLAPTFLHIHNSTLHFWVPLHPSSASGKPPLLLIHGFGGNAKWQFEKAVPTLAKSFDLYVPDLLFFGQSSTLEPDRSVEFQARCLVDAMARFGVRKYNVAGISYGGYVAYRVAEMAGKEVVEKVVIISAAVGMSKMERKEMVEKEGGKGFDILLPTKAEDLMELMRRSMFKAPKWMPEFLLTDFIQVMYKDRREEKVKLLEDLIANGAGVDPLPVLKQDTLILWGDQDTVFSLSFAHKLERHLGEKARLEVVEDAGHALPLEKPVIFNDIIKQFLTEPYQNLTSKSVDYLYMYLRTKMRLEVVKDAGHALPLEKPIIFNDIIKQFLIEPYQNL